MRTPRPQQRPKRESAGGKLATALELHDVGVDMMRQTLRRRHPDASEKQIDLHLQAWLSRGDEWHHHPFRQRT